MVILNLLKALLKNPLVLIGVVCLLVGSTAGWYFTGLSYKADIANLEKDYEKSTGELKLEHMAALKRITDQAAADSEAARKREHDFQTNQAITDAAYQKELSRVQQTAADLQRDIATGARRVQFANAALATCEQSTNAIASASRMVNGTALQLSTVAGRNILDIRTGAATDALKIRGLQTYIHELQKAGVVAGGSK